METKTKLCSYSFVLGGNCLGWQEFLSLPHEGEG